MRGATLKAAVACLAILGGIALFGIVIEQGEVIADKGIGGWADEPISGMEFMLTLGVVIAVPVVLGIGAIELIGRRLDERDRGR